ncbi:LolA family protein [Risungbinella massiliensis]|uniref:LolA family protein n=1 Tax=Risungbinella massiliensis TaxID=1329796 RepID=UPI0005CBF4B1|nr:outer membrane lipoprotein carrier protein LolA [Risungbinella massiliensis]
MRWLLSICLILSLVLSGCSTGASDVVSDLQKELKSVESYRSEGTLTIKTSTQPQEVDVQVAYLKPNFYRVELTNKQQNIKQIILKNEDGVFVVTPHLNKSFRFQSDWPQNSGQVYLYQTILQSVIQDEKRNMEKTEQGYQFEITSKNPLHQNWTKQKVVLNEKYQPKSVEVLNENQEAVISMKFSKFEKGTKLEKNLFATDQNVPKGEQKPSTSAPTDIQSVTPSYIPIETKLYDSQTIQGADGPIIIMRYDGKSPFTLIQRSPNSLETHLPLDSSLVDLQPTIAVLTEIQESRKLTWLDNGVEFELFGSLPLEEMVKIANSTASQPKK